MSPKENDDVVYLYYYPHLTDPIESTFSVARHSNRIVLALLKREPEFLPILTSQFTLYKPPELRLDPHETLLYRSYQWLRAHQDAPQYKFHPLQRVKNTLPDEPDSDVVNILVVTQDVLDGLDDILSLDAHYSEVILRRESTVEHIRNLVTSPSVGVSTSSGVQTIINNADKFHAGRPHDNYGPPVALFHPALGLLDYHLRHLDSGISEIELEPDSQQTRSVHLFITQALCGYPSDELRVTALRDSMSQALGFFIDWGVPIAGVTPTAVFGGVGGDFPFGIIELKNELGLGGDAFLQAGLTYARIVTDSKRQLAMRRWRSNYPAILIAIMGDILEIGIAVYTDGPYTDRIFSKRLGLNFHQNANVLCVARAFEAVRLALLSLREFYSRLDLSPFPDNGISHLFPSPLIIPFSMDDVPPLAFTSRLSRSGEHYILAKSSHERSSSVYLAVLSQPYNANGLAMERSSSTPDRQVEVIVKFTADYNANAHRLLAAANLAPALHACIPVCGNLFMVVMDLVYGEMASESEVAGKLLPYSVYKDVKTAIELLHEHNFVFGDLRSLNIMCTPAARGTELDERSHATLIDFDWTGTHNSSFYPAVINDMLPAYVRGIQRGGLMRKEHDLAMLERFESLCQPNPS